MSRLLLAALVAFALAVPARAQPPGAAALAEIDRIFEAWAPNAPGLVWGVVADGRLVHVRARGVQDVESRAPFTPDSLFRIASMSKAFTALAILKLRDEGRLSLDALAETYVPEMRTWRYPTTDSPKITVRNLLTHTAGFVEDNPWGDRQQSMTEAEFTRFLSQGVAFSRAPGLEMEYSNTGYAILGRIITNVSGRPYQAFIREEIMRPLGMGSTTYDVLASPTERRAIGYRREGNGWRREPDMADGVFGAMGGVETSANDYARWVAFLLSAWPARDGPDAGPVRRGTVREIVTGANFASAGVRDQNGQPCAQPTTYAMGWSVTEACGLGLVVGHTGGYPGYGSAVTLLPDYGIGVFAFSSLTYGNVSTPTNQAARVLERAGALHERPTPVSPGLAAVYDAARAVWRVGAITAAPLANNVLLDRDEAAWSRQLASLKSQVGECPAGEPIDPLSAMEGLFEWACERGAVVGRVQRSPELEVRIQALEFFRRAR